MQTRKQMTVPDNRKNIIWGLSTTAETKLDNIYLEEQTMMSYPAYVRHVGHGERYSPTNPYLCFYENEQIEKSRIRAIRRCFELQGLYRFEPLLRTH